MKVRVTAIRNINGVPHAILAPIALRGFTVRAGDDLEVTNVASAPATAPSTAVPVAPLAAPVQPQFSTAPAASPPGNTAQTAPPSRFNRPQRTFNPEDLDVLG